MCFYCGKRLDVVNKLYLIVLAMVISCFPLLGEVPIVGYKMIEFIGIGVIVYFGAVILFPYGLR